MAEESRSDTLASSSIIEVPYEHWGKITRYLPTTNFVN
jgi:hypothetical protein